MPDARPFLKWAGGKTFLLPQILSRLPAKIETYYEPFLGGGAVFFALSAERRFRRATVSDANVELHRTYRALRDNVSGVIDALKQHVYERQHYLTVRAQNPWHMSDTDAAARFVFLNKTCFNGLYRVNKKGQFNVPFGAYVNPTICDEANLRAVSAALAGVRVETVDFERAAASARKGDAVYFDPPYAPASETANFTAYCAGGFGPKDQERLRDAARGLLSRGAHVLISNSDTPLIRKLYRGWRVERVRAPRRVNSKAGGRGEVTELLIQGV